MDGVGAKGIEPHEGDVIESQLTQQHYVVTGNYGSHITAVQVVDVTHPGEWEIVYKVVPIHRHLGLAHAH